MSIESSQPSKTKIWMGKRRSTSLMLPAQVMQSSDEANVDSTKMLRIKVPGCRIISILGHGGMGTVFLARQETLDRLVAVKMLNQDLTGNPEFTERLLREARIMGKFSHPNLVNCHDVICNDDGVFIIMEYIPGHFSGRDVVRQFGAISEIYVVKILLAVCHALDYIREKGFLHLDMKPDNLLLQYESTRPLMNVGELFDRADSRVAVCDFGIAMRTKETSSAVNSSVMGSPFYMAPEQVLSPDTVDFRADMYAIGVIGWFFLSGMDPYHGMKEEDMLRMKIQEDFTISNVLEIPVSEGLEAILSRLGKVKPEERYQDYASLIRDLNAVRHELTEKHHSSVRLMRDIRKNIANLILYGLVIGMLALAGLGIFTQYMTEKRQRTMELSQPLNQWNGDTTGWTRQLDEWSYHPIIRGMPMAGKIQFKHTASPGEEFTVRVRPHIYAGIRFGLAVSSNVETEPLVDFGQIVCKLIHGEPEVNLAVVNVVNGVRRRTDIPGPVSFEHLIEPGEDFEKEELSETGEWIKLVIQVFERQCRIWRGEDLLGVMHYPGYFVRPEVIFSIDEVMASPVDLIDVVISKTTP